MPATHTSGQTAPPHAPHAPHHPHPHTTHTPRWMSRALKLAAIYNLIWGAWAVLDPRFPFFLIGAPTPTDAYIWQCLGMVIGVYGIGYWLASANPARHWPIVLVGLLGKVFGPIGFVWTGLITREAPTTLWPTLITNDLIWWIPFTLILAHAWRVNEGARLSALTTRDGSRRVDSPDHKIPEHALPDRAHPERALLERAMLSNGRSLALMSDDGPTLVVFLRHIGCTFCREAVVDLANSKPRLDAQGVSIALIHMSDPAKATPFFEKLGLPGVAHLSDPGRELYKAFELRRGSLTQLFGFRVFIRGIRAGLLDRHGVGKLEGDGFQMPGAFIIHKGRIIRAFRHEAASDRPDYCELATT